MCVCVCACVRVLCVNLTDVAVVPSVVVQPQGIGGGNALFHGRDVCVACGALLGPFHAFDVALLAVRYPKLKTARLRPPRAGLDTYRAPYRTTAYPPLQQHRTALVRPLSCPHLHTTPSKHAVVDAGGELDYRVRVRVRVRG
jgi:hypothetical protein